MTSTPAQATSAHHRTGLRCSSGQSAAPRNTTANTQPNARSLEPFTICTRLKSSWAIYVCSRGSGLGQAIIAVARPRRYHQFLVVDRRVDHGAHQARPGSLTSSTRASRTRVTKRLCGGGFTGSSRTAGHNALAASLYNTGKSWSRNRSSVESMIDGSRRQLYGVKFHHQVALGLVYAGEVPRPVVPVEEVKRINVVRRPKVGKPPLPRLIHEWNLL